MFHTDIISWAFPKNKFKMLLEIHSLILCDLKLYIPGTVAGKYSEKDRDMKGHLITAEQAVKQ